MTAPTVDAGVTGWATYSFSSSGGGRSARRTRTRPASRFARLATTWCQHNARLLIVGDTDDRARAAEVAGLISAPVVDLAGRLTLSELGALAEMADLYVGNDAGPTHVAAAVGCPTLAIFGPTNPAVSGPYATKGHVISLWRPTDGPFSWEAGVTTEEAAAAADLLLRRPAGTASPPS